MGLEKKKNKLWCQLGLTNVNRASVGQGSLSLTTNGWAISTFPGFKMDFKKKHPKKTSYLYVK